MDWPIWFLTLGVVFSLGFFSGHRLGLQEGSASAGEHAGTRAARALREKTHGEPAPRQVASRRRRPSRSIASAGAASASWRLAEVGEEPKSRPIA